MDQDYFWHSLYTRYYNGQLLTYKSSYKQLCKLCFQLTKVNKLRSYNLSLDEIMNKDGVSFWRMYLGKIPNYVCQLVNLQTLRLEHNKLTHLPSDFSRLTNLRTLYLGYNMLTQQEDCLCQLTNLRRLYLEHNGLTLVPSYIFKLTGLVRLDLDGNQLDNISGITGLLNLQVLELRCNPLKSIPELSFLSSSINIILIVSR